MILFPERVQGWLTYEEGMALAVFATGKAVLEIGSFKGRSTICMAQAARFVHAVDPFDGRATPHPNALTLDEFTRNIREWEVAHKVTAYKGTIDQIGDSLNPQYDLVFIDGAHDYASVRNDTEWALRLLREGGLIAYHDYRSKINPGVDAAVDDLLADGGDLLLTVGTVALVRPPRKLITGESGIRVVMAMPHRGQIHAGAARAFFNSPTMKIPASDLLRFDMSSSVLTLNFNRMWAEALNAREHGFTHFAMLHDDVCPEPGWLDILLAEIEREQADVVASVIPIKSCHGLTSTALGNAPPRNIFRPLRRLTMAETYNLPPTFSRKDIQLEGPDTLFINTGCWIADLRKDWVTKNCFRNVERLIRCKDRWKADCMSEDWAFSVDLERWGAKVLATRKVPLYHDRPEFHNKGPWGAWPRDHEYFERTEAAETEPAFSKG